MEDELVKRFIDVLILARLREESRLSGYDIISFVNKEFDVFVSPGKVYSVLYTLERNGLVSGVYDEMRREECGCLLPKAIRLLGVSVN